MTNRQPPHLQRRAVTRPPTVRSPAPPPAAPQPAFTSLLDGLIEQLVAGAASHERELMRAALDEVDRSLRDEIARVRDESRDTATAVRESVAALRRAMDDAARRAEDAPTAVPPVVMDGSVMERLSALEDAVSKLVAAHAAPTTSDGVVMPHTPTAVSVGLSDPQVIHDLLVAGQQRGHGHSHEKRDLADPANLPDINTHGEQMCCNGGTASDHRHESSDGRCCTDTPPTTDGDT